MKKLLALMVSGFLLCQPLSADPYKYQSGFKGDQPGASDVEANTSNFNGNLQSTDTTVQKALDRLDDLVSGGVNGSGLAGAVAYWATSSLLTYSANFIFESATATLTLYSSLGSEKVANGTFTGSASSWSVGSGFAYSSNSVSHSSNGTAALSQSVNALNGEFYLLTYTVSGWTAGNVTPTVGGFSGAAAGANGTYTERFIASSTASLSFSPTNTARFTIDDISLKKISGGAARIPGTVYTGEVTVSASNSNSSPGVTKHLSLKNPTGSYTWIESIFGSNIRSAIGFDASGNIYNYITNGAAQYWYTLTTGYFAYIFPSGFSHVGYGQFGGAVAANGGVNAGSGSVNPPSTLTSQGGSGARTIYITSNTTLDNSYTFVFVNPDNSNVCAGTPTYACNHWANSTDCELRDAHGGCSWFSGNSCSSFSYESGMSNCSSTTGCSVDTASCSGPGDQYSCEYQDDSYGGSCSWSNNPQSCSGFDEMTCGSYSMSGCSPIYTPCSPTFFDCTVYNGDEFNCNENSMNGCSWDGMNCSGGNYTGCSGGGSCSMYGDSSSCSSGTFYDGCGGSYDSYSCTGTYNTGNCSGVYGAACQGTSNCAGIDDSTNCNNEGGCTWSTGVSLTLPADSSNLGFYRHYWIKNVGSSGALTLFPNTNQTVNGTTSLSIGNGKARLVTLGYFTQSCSTWTGTNSSTCTTGHSGCSWTGCSGLDEMSCGSMGGSCSWNGSSCDGTGNCDGTWTIRRDWTVFGGVF